MNFFLLDYDIFHDQRQNIQVNQETNFQIMDKGTDFVTVTLASEDAETGDPQMCFNLKTRGFLRATSGQAGKFWSLANLGTVRKIELLTQGVTKVDRMLLEPRCTCLIPNSQYCLLLGISTRPSLECFWAFGLQQHFETPCTEKTLHSLVPTPPYQLNS